MTDNALTDAMRWEHLLALRGARQEVLADAENTEAVVFAIEAFGRQLACREATLSQAGRVMGDFVRDAFGEERATDLLAKLELLVHARNDRMHKGFAARNLAKDAVRVAVILEEALVAKWAGVRVEHVMTPSPTRAETWHTFGKVRDLIIENAFTNLPLRVGDTWWIVTERRVAVCVQEARAEGLDIRGYRLEQTSPVVAHAKDELWRRIVEEAPKPVDSMEPIPVLELSKGAVLITDARGAGALVGIVTPTDIF